MKDIKDIINAYIRDNELEQDSKRGHIKLDPLIHKLVGDCKPDQNQVKKEYVYKNLNSNLVNCYTVTILDEQQIIQDSQRYLFFKGDVPPVQIVAQKINNKKQTTI